MHAGFIEAQYGEGAYAATLFALTPVQTRDTDFLRIRPRHMASVAPATRKPRQTPIGGPDKQCVALRRDAGARRYRESGGKSDSRKVSHLTSASRFSLMKS